MGFAETILLGAIAGSTIYLGLPLARVSAVNPRLRVALTMCAVGLLAFIFMDVTSHAQQLVQSALAGYKAHHQGLGHVIGLFALLAVAFALGTAGIAAASRRIRPRRPSGPPIAGGAPTAAVTPGAVPDAELAAQAKRQALRTGMTIAVAIGLHNFAEGLAIGVSARTGAVGLATVLIVGFGLHNATEGFGIVGPLGPIKPSWRWIAVVGLIGGGPTFLGTITGYGVHSDALQLCFYALAGGAVMYVIGEIWGATRRFGYPTLALNALAFGFALGVATDLVVSYGGG